jgi:tetratricopeptide (TPR) repeat protein
MNSLERKLDQAYSVALERNDPEEALKICQELMDANPESAICFDTRARIYELIGDLEKAVDDISVSIDIDPAEPDYYFNRGRWHLGLGNYHLAVADQTKALDMGKQHNSQYYEKSSLFFRAAAFLALGMYEKALSDCENLDDDFAMYSAGVGRISKAEIVRKAEIRL